LYVTDEEGTNPVPFIVSVRELVPSGTDVGDKLVMVGCGLVDVVD